MKLIILSFLLCCSLNVNAGDVVIEHYPEQPFVSNIPKAVKLPNGLVKRYEANWFATSFEVSNFTEFELRIYQLSFFATKGHAYGEYHINIPIGKVPLAVVPAGATHDFKGYIAAGMPPIGDNVYVVNVIFYGEFNKPGHSNEIVSPFKSELNFKTQ